jgi:hypothetical protein
MAGYRMSDRGMVTPSHSLADHGKGKVAALDIDLKRGLLPVEDKGMSPVSADKLRNSNAVCVGDLCQNVLGGFSHCSIPCFA